ncbi:MAG: DUF1552 domain-containing protein [Candidatus Acidiferrales bacterium]
MSMMLFKKKIPRRAFVRGMSCAIALPLLDGMVPALAGTTVKAPVRLGTVFTPNGMWPMDKWTPKGVGTAFELSPTMEPLAPFRDQLLVLSGLAQHPAMPTGSDPTGEHARASSTFLTGIRPGAVAGAGLGGISMDQFAAAQFGKKTQLASLEVSLMANHTLVGLCEDNQTCLLIDTLCWSSPTTALPMETNPRAVFERLFGDVDNTDRAKQLAQMRQEASILDGVVEQVSSLLNKTDPADRAKLDQYFDAIRDIERRIQIAEQQPESELPKFDKPAGVPSSFDDYATLMMDLMVLAYQADLTRVLTFMMGREGPNSGLAYPQIGISDNHHSLSHHQNDPAKVEKLFQINLYNTKLFAKFLQKLKSTSDGDGNLLDHTILLYGSSLSNGNGHDHHNLPLLLAGGGGGQIKGGRHLQYPDMTPMTNLHLALLDKLGVPVEKLGDSTGELNLLSV